MNETEAANESFYESSLSHGEPVILYMHGNSGSRGSSHRVELYTLLRNLNYHVIAFDYRSEYTMYSFLNHLNLDVSLNLTVESTIQCTN